MIMMTSALCLVTSLLFGLDVIKTKSENRNMAIQWATLLAGMLLLMILFRQ